MPRTPQQPVSPPRKAVKVAKDEVVVVEVPAMPAVHPTVDEVVAFVRTQKGGIAAKNVAAHFNTGRGVATRRLQAGADRGLLTHAGEKSASRWKAVRPPEPKPVPKPEVNGSFGVAAPLEPTYSTGIDFDFVRDAASEALQAVEATIVRLRKELAQAELDRTKLARVVKATEGPA